MDNWIEITIALPLNGSIVNIITDEGVNYIDVKYHQENHNWEGYFDNFEFNVFVLLDNVIKWSY